MICPIGAILRETTEASSTKLTVYFKIVSDDDATDMVRCSQIDCPPRMNVRVGARRSIMATVNCPTCNFMCIPADLFGSLVQCDVVHVVDCTTRSHVSRRNFVCIPTFYLHSNSGAQTFSNGPLSETWPPPERRINDKADVGLHGQHSMCLALHIQPPSCHTTVWPLKSEGNGAERTC